jgi:sulfur-oxidizing protein SoxY
MKPARRSLLLAGAALVVRPAFATPEALDRAVAAFTGGAPLREGRVKLDIAPLVENGNTVPVTISVPGADSVRRLALFTERNPQPEVAVFALGPLAARATVATRMRLATSQSVIALAELPDGSFWQQRVQVVVTLAACVEGG